MKYVAIIPLRAGSKGIPRKNLKLLAGKPMFQWTLEAAVNTKEIEQVFISTDDAEIKQVIKSLKIENLSVVDRSPETATDTASTESALLEFAAQHHFDNLVLIQATSPLLRSEDLRAGIEKFEASQADSLLSVVRQKRFLWEDKVDGSARATNYDPMRRPRRQEFDGFLVENGAFYIFSRTGLMKTNNRLFGQITTYEMPESSYFEIDEPEDWVIAEQLLKRAMAQRMTAHNKPSLAELRERAKKIKLFISDVDGVLTDSGMYYTEKGDELKKFNTRDGKAFELIKELGIKTAIITSENTKIVARRAEKMRIDYLEQGAIDKFPAFERVIRQAGVTAEEVAYIGDDLGDLPLLKVVGLGCCPADAIREAKAVADFTAECKGGAGCLREIYIELFS